MRPTQLRELIATIRKTFVSFISIMMFVALGVGVFQGIYWSGPGLQRTADDVYAEQSFYDFQIQYPYGLTEADVTALGTLDGVTTVEPGRVAFETARGGDGTYTFKIQSMGMDIDNLVLADGVLPEKQGQIAVLDEAARANGIKVGDKIVIEKEDSEEPDEDGEGSTSSLTSSEFTVTGLVKSPEYIATDNGCYGISPTPTGKVDAVAWVVPAAFDGSAFHDGFNLVNVSCESLAGLETLGAAYENESASIESGIVGLGSTLSAKRFDEIHSDAEKKIDDGEEELDSAREKIADGEKQIADAKSQLADARNKVASGSAELEKAKAKVAEGEKQLNAAKDKLATESAGSKAKLDEAKNQLSIAQMLYDEGVSALEEAQAELEKEIAAGELTPEEIAAVQQLQAEFEAELAKDKAELDKAKQEYTAAKSQYDTETAKARKEIAAKEAELQAAKNTIANKEAELASARNQIATAETEIPQKEAELADAKKELEKNEAKFEKAKKDIEEMRSVDWTVNSRLDNGSVLQIETLSDITRHLSYSMAALFLIVGLLVSYSAISRLVREQITQVGTKKALGLRSREITMSFLMYSGIAVVAGVIVGFLVSMFAVQPIISQAFGEQFTIGNPAPYFDVKLLAIAAALEIVLVLGTTWLAARSILKRNAVDLLRGEEPPSGKQRFFEKWSLWNRLPLYTQTIVNNCINDKRRVFSTIVGIAGCTALIVTALTLNDNVKESYERHYEEVYSFNSIAYSDSSVNGAMDYITAALDDTGFEYAPVVRERFAASLPDGGAAPLTLITPTDEEAFDRFYHVNARDGASFDLASEGVWVSEAYARHQGVKVGDTITLDNAAGERHELPIAGFYEFYLTNYEAVIGPGAYASIFGTAPEPNEMLINTGDKSFDELERELTGTEGLFQLQDHKTIVRSDFDAFSSVSQAVVMIYLALSVLMAIVVLLNLNVMFIDEKKRDLIVLMINGFTVRQAKRYIYQDTIVLTIVGIIIGLIVGALMGSVSVACVEPISASFLKGIDPIAIIAAIVASAVLSFIMSSIALRRIPRFNLTDINRI